MNSTGAPGPDKPGPNVKKGTTMKLFAITTITAGALTAAALGFAGAATVAAPIAAAASQQSCTALGGSTQCQTPGNAQIYSHAPAQPSLGPLSAYGPFFAYDRGGR